MPTKTQAYGSLRIHMPTKNKAYDKPYADEARWHMATVPYASETEGLSKFLFEASTNTNGLEAYVAICLEIIKWVEGRPVSLRDRPYDTHSRIQAYAQALELMSW